MNNKLWSATNLKLTNSAFNDLVIKVLNNELGLLSARQASDLTQFANITISHDPTQLSLTFHCDFQGLPNWSIIQHLFTKTEHQLTDQTVIKWSWNFDRLWNIPGICKLINSFLERYYPNNDFKKTFLLEHLQIINHDQLLIMIDGEKVYKNFIFLANDLRDFLRQTFHKPQLVIKTELIDNLETTNNPTIQQDSVPSNKKTTLNIHDPHFPKTFKVWKIEITAVRSFQKPRYLVDLKNGDLFYSCRLSSAIIKNKSKLKLLTNLPTIQPVFSSKTPFEYTSYADLYLEDFVVVDDQPNPKVEGESKISQLYLHTKASTQDGLFYYEDFAKLAKSLGHHSLAITDWNSATEYPKVEQIAKKLGIKPIYGVELEVIDDHIPVAINSQVNPATIQDAVYCVFDIETTGLNGAIDHVIEIAVRRYHHQELLESFKCLIKTPKELPSKIVELTGITNQHLADEGLEIHDALTKFQEFIGNDILVAHNGINFDFPFINARLIANGFSPLNNCLVDTMQLSRGIFYKERSHNLAALCRRLDVNYDEIKAHRADEDVAFLSDAFYKLLDQLIELGIDLGQTWSEFQFTDVEMVQEFRKKNFTNTICAYAKNQAGIRAIYQLISLAHTEYFLRTPTIPWSRVNQLRKDLIITNSPDRSDLWEAVLMGNNQAFVRLVKNYDYVLIAPPSCYQHQINRNNYSQTDCQKLINNFYQLTIANNKKPIANGVVKYLNSENQIQYNALVHAKMIGGGAHQLYSYHDSNLVLPDYQFKTGLQLAEEFSFLNLDQNSLNNFIYDHNAEFVNEIDDRLKIINKKLQPPLLPDGEQKLLALSKTQLAAKYGTNPDPIILDRFNQEINAIVKHGFSIIYWASHLLVKKSIADGYLVGSRGSVGSSLIAYLIDITEVNPLPPHYYCSQCFYTEFYLDFNDSGFDLIPKPCPKCQNQLIGDGQNIPFATFIGFDGDKTPDIDLNFSGEYQAQAHNYLRTLFGQDYCFRAGTISTVADKTAYGFAKNFLELTKHPGTFGLINWITEQITDVRRTSGQHPGGILVIPNNLSVYDFTPVNYPADDLTSDWKTTHIAYEYLHDSLLKFDVLGHDDPTILKKLHQLTNYDPRSIPNHDPQLLKMFTSCEVIGVLPKQILNEKTGAIGLPEFGTNFVRSILTDAQPNSFGDLIRISGLSHGTDVWKSNAENLVKKQGIKLNQLISCRDDIMVDLINHKVDPLTAFNIMENVRKGKQIPANMIPMLKEHGIANWYIESANLIKYMFPKAHAAAYVLMAWRVAFYKFYFPTQFYAAYFSIRSDNFDVETLMTNDPQIIEEKYRRINSDLKSKNPEVRKRVKTKDKNLLVIYEVALEMLSRKIQFAPINLNQSAATDFLPINNEQIMIPFIAIDGLGQIAANNIVNERNNGSFTSQEDLERRVKLSKKLIKKMEDLKIIDESKKISQFSLLDME